MRKFIEAIAVFILVALGLWLLAQLFVLFKTEPTRLVAEFLDKTNIVIGLLAAIWHYFFGPDTSNWRRVR